MERRINKIIENYISDFKENIRNKSIELNAVDANTQQLIQYICDYDRLILNKEDLMKRKRVKNSVNLSERCCAKRASGEQCTRRRKDDTTEYCGTHMKGLPHGICEIGDEDNNKQKSHKIEVWAQDINGIICYIDNNSNVYRAEDIMQGKSNPDIIARYTKEGEVYSVFW